MRQEQNGKGEWAFVRPVSAALTVAVGVFVLATAMAAVEEPRAVPGDLNGDGVVNTSDVGPFVLAVNDQYAWFTEYDREREDLLAVADFDRDLDVDTDDIPGFCALVAASFSPRGGGRSPLAGERTGGAGSSVDLDIDSDNDDGTGVPDRSAAEDLIEDDPFQTGKQIVTGLANRVKAVLDPEISSAAPFGSVDMRLTFPGNISVAVAGWEIWTGQGVQTQNPIDLTSGTTFDYPYGSWILGDMNGDGALTASDIDPFVLALTNEASYETQYGMDAHTVGDITGDWQLTSHDIDPFVALLSTCEERPIPVRLLVEGDVASVAQGVTRIFAEVDCDGDSTFDAEDETDAVRTTVWDGSNMPPVGELGAPRAWGAGMGVSPYSTVNLRNGNVLTAIPLVSWDPVGPAVQFALYHNSLSDTPGTGFELSGGWCLSYGSQIEGSSTDAAVTVVSADGRRTVYTKEDGEFVPPAGVHDTLVWDTQASEWELTSPGQWKSVYDSAGRLIELHDSAGNVSTIDRDDQHDYRITCVKSAADGLTDVGNNRLDFSYSGDTLSWVRDAKSRKWYFEYEETGDKRLLQIAYPYEEGTYVTASHVGIVYESGSNRIEDITSRDGKTWSYDYTDGKLTLAQDPTHDLGGKQYVRYAQEFDYGVSAVDGLPEITYTDRRDYDWITRFDGLGNAVEVENPLSETHSWTYDARHNMLSATDDLGHTWTYTYDDADNIETISSPLTGGAAQTWTYTWIDPVLPGDPPNLYRVQRVEDPEGNGATYAYADANDPTLVTSITEDADGQGGTAAVTTLEYYGSATPEANGQVRLIIDANDVRHYFTYDEHGYFEQNLEGLATTREVGIPPDTNPVDGGKRTSGPTGETTHQYEPGEGSCYDWFVVDANGDRYWCGEACPYRSPGATTRLGNVPSPAIPVPWGCGGSYDRDVVGRVLSFEGCWQLMDGGFRNGLFAYDDLGRLTSATMQTGTEIFTGQVDWQVDRTYSILSYDEDGRALSVQGPDGQTVAYTFNGQPGYDQLGRPKTVTRGGMSATYHYEHDANGRLERVEHGNGTEVVRHYDAAERLDWIKHLDPLDAELLRIDYVWNVDNKLASRTETNNATSQTVDVVFTYDDRGRLIGETRDIRPSTDVYDISYTYDQLGNRLEKIDSDAGRKTVYYYDSDPANREAGFETNNNRLLWYEEYASDGQGGWQATPARTVRYTYYVSGHVSNITIKDEYDGYGTAGDFEWYYDLALYYDVAGRVYRVLWDRWTLDGQGAVDDYERLAGREFGYDGLGARFMTRELDVTAAQPDLWEPVNPWQWTDATGSGPWGDFETDVVEDPPGTWSATVSETMRYLAAGGLHAQQTLDGQGDPVEYLHGDLIDSTMLTTDASGAAAATLAYTAFGEAIGDPSLLATRYQYGGGYGYESDLLWLNGAPGTSPITLQHLGARWYQPEIGRFVQRDPIGIVGGVNSYAYCGNEPLAGVDPSGLSRGRGARGNRFRPRENPPGFGGPLIFPPPTDAADTPGGYYPDHQMGLVEVSHRVLCDAFCLLPPPGELQYKPKRQRFCPHCGFGPCTGHWEPAPDPRPTPTPRPKGTPPHFDPEKDRKHRQGVIWDPLCFPAGTVVYTDSGFTRIEDVAIGDSIWTWAFDRTIPRMTVVLSRSVTDASVFTDVTVEDVTIRSTPDHEYCTETGAWIAARDLRPGMRVRTLNGSAAIVDVSTEKVPSPVPVYNLHIKDYHWYFVSPVKVLVHNVGC